MPEIVGAFLSTEGRDERANSPVKPWDGALSNLAEVCLECTESILDGVKVWRILRQISKRREPPAIRFARGSNFGAYWFAFATACQSARLPLSDQTRTAPGAPEAFTSRLSDGSVTLPAAGYDYDIDWTPMSAGLAPAGTAASFAALARMERSVIRDRPLDMP